MDDIKNAKYYQELTFEALSKYIETEARKGFSKWYLPSGMYMGEQMVSVLKNKGFVVYQCGSTTYISW
jgi:hypothetical protein